MALIDCEMAINRHIIGNNMTLMGENVEKVRHSGHFDARGVGEREGGTDHGVKSRLDIAIIRVPQRLTTQPQNPVDLVHSGSSWLRQPTTSWDFLHRSPPA
jgi:hypothetical protein